MSALALLKALRTRFTWRELRKSLLATFALGLALGASLASSVAASEGNTATAVALAGLSLLLALGIALTVVPRLWQRARREWQPLSFSINREGWYYLLALLVISFAAFNTGNNLIFIILSASLALLVVSEVLSSLNLKRLALQIDLPDSVPAGQTFVSALHLCNLKGWFPVFSLSIRVHVRSTGSKARGPSTRLRSDLGTCGQVVYSPFLATRAHFQQAISLQLSHRGRHGFEGIEISTRFPFGFVSKRRIVPQIREIIALPEVEPPNEFFEMLPLLNGAFESFYRGWGTDLHSIREYSLQDSARFLDWKASAKTGRLLVREFTREDDRKCCFVFDNGVSNYQQADEPAFEKAVRICANAARHFQAMGCEIRLVTPDASTIYGKSEEQLQEILEVLALIQPEEPGRLSLKKLMDERSFKILFTSRSRGMIPTSLWNSSHVVFFGEWSPGARCAIPAPVQRATFSSEATLPRTHELFP
jgi:uncharacterized protein (DUF58 family)